MATILYAEVYVICFLVVALLLYWTCRNGSNSTQERWLRRVLAAFLVNFAANLLFTAVSDVQGLPGVILPLAYGLKTVYHISLCVGIYAWCGYADAMAYTPRFQTKKARLAALIPMAVPIAFALVNLKTHGLFEITGELAYVRHALFQWEMGYLTVLSTCFSVPLVMRLSREFEPALQSHIRLTASFPLCLVAAWALSFVGERIPVICVCVMIELLCLYVDTSSRQISMDKLTQVNNRQNLLGFLEYKLRNHDESMFLLMIDVDYFKDINDTYGHLEGDDALVQVAKVLKQSCADYQRRPYIARYGGDEFIVMLEGSRAEADALCERIQANITAACERLNKPYRLTLSIGMGRWEPSMNTKDFIEAADSELYKIKRARTKPT